MESMPLTSQYAKRVGIHVIIAGLRSVLKEQPGVELRFTYSGEEQQPASGRSSEPEDFLRRPCDPRAQEALRNAIEEQYPPEEWNQYTIVFEEQP